LLEVLQALRRDDVGTLAEMTLPRLLGMFGQICQAIHYAHTRGFCTGTSPSGRRRPGGATAASTPGAIASTPRSA
jgi:hypothetical protein